MTAIPNITPIFPTGPDALPIPALAVPAGAPRWVTPELLADTLRIWRPYYGNLTSQDALAIILNVGNLFDLHDGPRCPAGQRGPRPGAAADRRGSAAEVDKRRPTNDAKGCRFWQSPLV